MAGWRGMLGGASSSSSLAKAGSPARKDGSGTRSRSSSGSLTVAGSRGDERRFGLPGETYRSTNGRVARFNVGLVVRLPPRLSRSYQNDTRRSAALRLAVVYALSIKRGPLARDAIRSARGGRGCDVGGRACYREQRLITGSIDIIGNNSPNSLLQCACQAAVCRIWQFSHFGSASCIRPSLQVVCTSAD